MNSRAKGKVGELEWRDVLRAHGYEARRDGQQGAGGSADAPDVRHNIPGVHFEVKRVEAINIGRCMAQAVKDAGGKLAPLVAHRRNREEWLITMRADDFFSFLLQTGIS